MANIKYFPSISEISSRFFLSEIHKKTDLDSLEFYASISSLDTPDSWKRLANNDSRICDEIFAKLETTANSHSGGSWACLVGYYRQIAKNGVSDRFLLKNERFWVGGYYIPDYYPEILFVASAAIIVSACRLK
jgi:hypothetical protein